MENYEKYWIHHCTVKIENIMRHLENQLSQRKTTAMIQERGASAKRTPADLRESLMSRSSHERRASMKSAAMFSLGNEESGNQLKSSFFKNADPSNLGRSLLEDKERSFAPSDKIWTYEKGTSSWIPQYLYQRASATSLCSKIRITGRITRTYWNSTRTSTTTRRISYEENDSPRYSNPKYTRNVRNEESSRTASWRSLSAKIKRKSWDNTKTHFTSTGNTRTDEFCEWFRRISRSGIRLQWEIVGNVSSQSAMISSSHSILSRDKRLSLDTWNTSGL